MKNYLFIVASVLLLSACNRGELDKTISEKDSLQLIVNARDSSLNDFIAAFNEVECNLDSVSAKQHIISVNSDKPGELKATQKSRINSEIAAINTLMDQNRKKLAELTRKQKNSAYKNSELEKTIAIITGQLAEKNTELSALNEKLNNLNAQVAQLQTSVSTLTEEGNAKSQTIAEETTALHTAYYAVGQSKDLQDAKLIDRKGGLLGIGKTAKLSADIDNSKFTRIDYTQTTNIAINGELKIITTHPSDSYTLEMDEKHKSIVKNIVITDPEKFWSASKYLVAIKD